MVDLGAACHMQQLWWGMAVLVVGMVAAPSSTLNNHPPRINRCYSCMSSVYEQFFREESSHLSKFFYEPRNFTNQCDEPMNAKGMGVVPCRAICLTTLGRKTGKLLTMRGCATSLSRFGFYNRTIAIFDQYDMCREMLANELFKYDTDSQPLQVCSCLGDRCNSVENFRPLTKMYNACGWGKTVPFSKFEVSTSFQAPEKKKNILTIVDPVSRAAITGAKTNDIRDVAINRVSTATLSVEDIALLAVNSDKQCLGKSVKLNCRGETKKTSSDESDISEKIKNCAEIWNEKTPSNLSFNSLKLGEENVCVENTGINLSNKTSTAESDFNNIQHVKTGFSHSLDGSDGLDAGITLGTANFADCNTFSASGYDPHSKHFEKNSYLDQKIRSLKLHNRLSELQLQNVETKQKQKLNNKKSIWSFEEENYAR